MEKKRVLELSLSLDQSLEINDSAGSRGDAVVTAPPPPPRRGSFTEDAAAARYNRLLLALARTSGVRLTVSTSDERHVWAQGITESCEKLHGVRKEAKQNQKKTVQREGKRERAMM